MPCPVVSLVWFWSLLVSNCCLGVGTKIDPTLCRADRMVGQVLGSVGGLPEVYTELEISFFLLRRLLGVRTEGDKKAAKVRPRVFQPADTAAGPEANEERGADGQHRLAVDGRPCHGCQGRSCEDFIDTACLYGSMFIFHMHFF
jgi:hypothetical protein